MGVASGPQRAKPLLSVPDSQEINDSSTLRHADSLWLTRRHRR
jgi:hypothetical protein